jgi:dTDP-4-dehydrorhamnose 3,5-epimerase
VIFLETDIPGALIIDLDRHTDDRGFFARAWCEEEFAAHGLRPRFVQANMAFTERSGTVRGLHYQHSPHEEAKLIRCTRGSIHDVLIDLRRDSPSFEQWIAVELSADNRRMLHVPEGCAHGYQALSDGAEVFYLVTHPYVPGAEGGIRFDDPAFGVQWPLPVGDVSAKDRRWPVYVRQQPGSNPG